MSSKVFKMNEEGMSAMVQASGPVLTLSLDSHDKIEDLRRVFLRGLNTFDTAPEWLLDFSNFIDLASGRMATPAPFNARKVLTVIR